MAETKVQSYSNVKIIGASALALLASLSLLVIFIVFVSISKPSFKDLNKFVFTVLVISFCLFIIYGICGFLKDDSITTYGLKTWLCCLIASLTIITLGIIALLKSRDRHLPTSCLWISIIVAGLILLINTEFCLDDMRAEPFLVGEVPGYMAAETKEREGKPEYDLTMVDKGSIAEKEYMADKGAALGRSQSKVSNRDSNVSIPPGGSLRVEINPQKGSLIGNYRKTNDEGKLSWERTHFIIGLESGAAMKRMWGNIITGLQSWVKGIPDGDVLISLFTFDSTFHIVTICKSPSEILRLLEKGIEARGGSEISLSVAIDTLADIIQSPEFAKSSALNYLHYGFILIGEDAKYPVASISKFLEFKKKNGINFFFNIVSQVNKTDELTKLASALEGVHYSIREGANFGNALFEALERNVVKTI